MKLQRTISRDATRIKVLNLAWAFLAVLFSVHAQAPLAREPELLNSERIEQAFGSYGIEVLSSTSALRVSELYSTHGDRRICRTFAVVVYPREVDPAIVMEHEAIRTGGSIGATFVASGWRVLKDHRYFGEIDSTVKLGALMGGLGPTELAVHVYVLSVAKDGTELEYASIVEVHHPEYLSAVDLHEMYGDELPATDDSVESLLTLAAEQMR